VSFRFEAGLLDLLLLQRQCVFHGVGFALGLQYPYLGLALRLLYLLNLLRFGFEFGDSHLLSLNVGLNSHAIAFLFFQQQVFQALGVFRWQLDVT